MDGIALAWNGEARRAFLLGYAFIAGRNHARWLADDAFEESDHPRGKGGKFKRKGSGAKGWKVAGPKDFDNAIDKVLETIKGKSRKQLSRGARRQSARQDYGRKIEVGAGGNPIHALVLSRGGHVKDAYQRPDIRGLEHIDVFWGNASAGLMHIIMRRLGGTNDRNEVRRVLRNLNDTIRHGRIRNDLSGSRSAVLQYGHAIAVISLSYKDDGTRQAVITGYSEHWPRREGKISTA